jgi:hypothetical protein
MSRQIVRLVTHASNHCQLLIKWAKPLPDDTTAVLIQVFPQENREDKRIIKVWSEKSAAFIYLFPTYGRMLLQHTNRFCSEVLPWQRIGREWN